METTTARPGHSVAALEARYQRQLARVYAARTMAAAARASRGLCLTAAELRRLVPGRAAALD